MNELELQSYKKNFYYLDRCHPIRTKDQRRSIVESIGKVEEIYKEVSDFFEKKENRFGFVINGDTPLKILEDFLRPFHQGSAFGGNENYFKTISSRLGGYFGVLHYGTIYSMLGEGNPEELEDEYDKLFDIFRSKIMTKVDMACNCMLLWYHWDKMWKTSYKRFKEFDKEYRDGYQNLMDRLNIRPGMEGLFDGKCQEQYYETMHLLSEPRENW